MEYLDYFQYNSLVILTYFFICFGVMIIHTLTKGESTKRFFSTSSNSSLLNPITYIRFFTHALGHGSWEHFTHNFLQILLIGPMVEEKYGSYNEYWHDFVTCPVCGAATELTDYNGNGPTNINCETDPLIEIVYPNEAEL